MSYFTNSRPSLISDQMRITLEQNMEKARKQGMTWTQRFYENVIMENKLFCFIIIALICFLIYLYVKKNIWNEPFMNTVRAPYPNNNSYADQYVQPHSLQFGGMDSPNERIARPTFNPYYSVDTQQSYVNYLPDQVPVISNGKMIDNVEDMPYTAPVQHDTYQYSGPYYRNDNNIVSDDLYQGFSQANINNLDQFDELIRQKTRDDFMHGKIESVDGYDPTAQ